MKGFWLPQVVYPSSPCWGTVSTVKVSLATLPRAANASLILPVAWFTVLIGSATGMAPPLSVTWSPIWTLSPTVRPDRRNFFEPVVTATPENGTVVAGVWVSPGSPLSPGHP